MILLPKAAPKAAPKIVPFPTPLRLSADRLRHYAEHKVYLAEAREKLKKLETLLVIEQAEIERLLAAGAEITDD